MNVSSITLRQLRVFDAVARHGSLTRAAGDLFVTKAAVSAALKELETQLGAPLFDRVANRLRLNACGAQLRPLADDVLARMAALEAAFGGGGGLGGTLRIGASVTIGNHILPRLLAAYLPRVAIPPPQVTIANTARLSGMLLRYDLDVAFVEGSTHGAALAVEPLWRDRLRVIAAPGHRLADGRVRRVGDLARETWVLREADSGTREQFARRLEPEIPWTLGLEFDTNEAIVNAVAAGLGLGFLSELAIADALAAGRVAAVALEEVHDRSLDAAVARGKFQSPLLRDFLDFCRGWTAEG